MSTYDALETPPAKRPRTDAALQTSVDKAMQATTDTTDTAVQVQVPSVQLEEFHARYLAFGQFVDVCREAGSGKTARRETWKLTVRSEHVHTDVLRLFSGVDGKGSHFTKTRLFQNTEVTFLRDGVAEDGKDFGGLTVELYALFFRQVSTCLRSCKHNGSSTSSEAVAKYICC